MPTRRPMRAQSCAVFPSLAALTAGGVIASGCHAPQCGDSRDEELHAHGALASNALREGRGRDVTRELALGLGLRAHETPQVPVMGGGAAPQVTVVPPPPPQTPPSLNEVMAPGQMLAVGPQPLEEPPTPTPNRHGRSARARSDRR